MRSHPPRTRRTIKDRAREELSTIHMRIASSENSAKYANDSIAFYHRLEELIIKNWDWLTQSSMTDDEVKRGAPWNQDECEHEWEQAIVKHSVSGEEEAGLQCKRCTRQVHSRVA